MDLTLYLNYKVPSLNVTKRQHWAAQHKEKQKAFHALASALSGIASDPSIQTTSPEDAKTCSTAYATLVSYLGTNRGASYSRPNKLKSRTTRKKKLKSP